MGKSTSIKRLWMKRYGGDVGSGQSRTHGTSLHFRIHTSYKSMQRRLHYSHAFNGCRAIVQLWNPSVFLWSTLTLITEECSVCIHAANSEFHPFDDGTLHAKTITSSWTAHFPDSDCNGLHLCSCMALLTRPLW